MKKMTMLCLFVLMGVNAFSQSNFKKGYFINNDGKKIECYIQNVDWLDNPTNFKYKSNENSKILVGNISMVKEFSIENTISYKRFAVDIDRSSKRTNQLSRQRTPEYKKEILFLRVLVSGELASLYSYVDSDLRRYFYATPTQKITQLIYKSYLTEKGRVSKNELYKRQISANFPCPSIKNSPSYTKKSLTKYFVAFNNCNATDANLIDYTLNQTKGKLKLKIKGGASYFKTDATDINVIFGDNDFSSDSKINPRFGIELQYLLPFNNNRWGFIIEPSYQSYKGEAALFITGAVVYSRVLPIDYKSIEVPVGFVHYFSSKKESGNVFLNGGIILDFPIDSTIGNREITTSTSIFAGIGYEFDQKYSLEFRYNGGRQLTKLSGLETNYNGITVSFGYTLF